MASTLPFSHILRHFLLFAFVVIFLMTTIRAGYSLWQFPRMLEHDAVVDTFLTGIRFDVALVGAVLLVPVIVCSLLGMFDFSRGFAKAFLIGWLSVSLFAILMAELITPLFMVKQELRPDLPMLQQLKSPAAELNLVANRYLMHTAIGLILVFLIMFAFIVRLETHRLYRYRLSRWHGLGLAIVGSLLCIMAIWSNWDLSKTHFNPGDGLISADATVNDITLNSSYKIVYSSLSPLLSE